jgi:thymidine kinase
METKHWHVENKKIVYWTQRVFSKFHETYLTTTVHETFEGKEINLVDDFVKDLLSKEDVSVVYVKEVKTLSQTIVYKG